MAVSPPVVIVIMHFNSIFNLTNIIIVLKVNVFIHTHIIIPPSVLYSSSLLHFYLVWNNFPPD